MNLINSERFVKPISAVIFGGAGAEHKVSVMSAENILAKAKERGISVLPVYISEDGGWYVFDKELSPLLDDRASFDPSRLSETYPVRLGKVSGFFYNGEIIRVSRALVLLHGNRGEDGEIQGALLSCGIPYFGESVIASAIAADKEQSKLVADSLGIPTARSVTLRSDMNISDAVRLAQEWIGYPCFIKPAALGSSIGAGRADSSAELIHRIEIAFSVSEKILCEEAFTDKRELECAYLSVDGSEIITHPGEILCDGFYDYYAKYGSPRATVARANVTDEISKRIKDYTARLARAVGIRKMGRFDYFLLPSGNVIFNEINAIPGMTYDSLYPKMLEAFGISFGELVSILLGGALW